MLVTNQSSNVREVCRAIYLQFLLDYPQGRGRLKESLAFLAKNLSYTFESGRLSVLELVAAILAKFATQLVQDSADLFFVGLVMVVANDDSTRCREMAAELVKVLFTRVEKETRDTLLTMLHSWAGKRAQPQLARTAIQLFGVAIDALGADGRSSAPPIVDVVLDILTDSEERSNRPRRRAATTCRTSRPTGSCLTRRCRRSVTSTRRSPSSSRPTTRRTTRCGRPFAATSCIRTCGSARRRRASSAACTPRARPQSRDQPSRAPPARDGQPPRRGSEGMPPAQEPSARRRARDAGRQEPLLCGQVLCGSHRARGTKHGGRGRR